MDRSEAWGGIWNGARRAEELVNQALTAREFYLKGKQYVIAAGLGEIREGEDPNQEKVVIVDEFTGRLMPDRTWRDGLHQALEAKEEIIVNPPKDTYARISFQRFFRSYRRLCGMTGTAMEARRELWQIYKLPVVAIPTNKPCIRDQLPDRIFPTEDAKFAAIVQEIQRLHARGQPILVGTRSVKTSERLSDVLTKLGMAHEVLNAVRHVEKPTSSPRPAGTGRLPSPPTWPSTWHRHQTGTRGPEAGRPGGASRPNGAVKARRPPALRTCGEARGSRDARRRLFPLDDELLVRNVPKLEKSGVPASPVRNESTGDPALSGSFFKRGIKAAQRRALRKRKRRAFHG